MAINKINNLFVLLIATVCGTISFCIEKGYRMKVLVVSFFLLMVGAYSFGQEVFSISDLNKKSRMPASFLKVAGSIEVSYGLENSLELQASVAKRTVNSDGPVWTSSSGGELVTARILAVTCYLIENDEDIFVINFDLPLLRGDSFYLVGGGIGEITIYTVR